MHKGYKRHSDEDVIFWAETYTELGMTLEELEKELGISHSTAFWCFVNRLPYINSTLYQEVAKTLDINKHNKRARA